MKRVLAIAVLAALTLSSCGSSKKKPVDHSKVDKAYYEFKGNNQQ